MNLSNMNAVTSVMPISNQEKTCDGQKIDNVEEDWKVLYPKHIKDLGEDILLRLRASHHRLFSSHTFLPLSHQNIYDAILDGFNPEMQMAHLLEEMHAQLAEPSHLELEEKKQLEECVEELA